MLRRGYRRDDVDALLHRLAYELGWRSRLLAEVSAENDRIKRALRAWQSEQARERHDRMATHAGHLPPDR